MLRKVFHLCLFKGSGAAKQGNSIALNYTEMRERLGEGQVEGDHPKKEDGEMQNSTAETVNTN